MRSSADGELLTNVNGRGCSQDEAIGAKCKCQGLGEGRKSENWRFAKTPQDSQSLGIVCARMLRCWRGTCSVSGCCLFSRQDWTVLLSLSYLFCVCLHGKSVRLWYADYSVIPGEARRTLPALLSPPIIRDISSAALATLDQSKVGWSHKPRSPRLLPRLLEG